MDLRPIRYIVVVTPFEWFQSGDFCFSICPPDKSLISVEQDPLDASGSWFISAHGETFSSFDSLEHAIRYAENYLLQFCQENNLPLTYILKHVPRINTGNWRNAPATESQLIYLRHLTKEEPAAGLTKGAAAKLISDLKAARQ